MNSVQQQHLTVVEKLAALRISWAKGRASNSPAALKAHRLKCVVSEANELGMRLWQANKAVHNIHGDSTVLLASHGHFGATAHANKANANWLEIWAQGGLTQLVLWYQEQEFMALLIWAQHFADAERAEKLAARKQWLASRTPAQLLQLDINRARRIAATWRETSACLLDEFATMPQNA